jgi:hypothetical protein
MKGGFTGKELFWFLAFTLVAILGARENMLKNQYGKERGALLAEQSEWRKEAFTAVRARGWVMAKGSVSSPDNVTPEVLRYALNPCYATPAGNYLHQMPDCALLGPAEKADPIPIRITAADEWPK